jgi:asparagine synthase (glutamine-hydrolysing)
MAYYGPDGGGSAIDGPVGMGHLLLEVNPEDSFERQPFRGRRGLLVCTARLDNRDALLEAFDVPASEAPQTSDAHLLSLAFDRWGEEVCPHLEGDWSLAAWDAKQKRLFVARDVFGSPTLYYYEGNGFFAFASSLKALLALPGIVKEPDLLQVAQFLVFYMRDAELTAYKGLRRLVLAHRLTVTSNGQVHTSRYWSPKLHEPIRYARDSDYVEAFLELYTRAVRSCLRSRKVISAELSGGLDSGSVVTLAAPMLAAEGRELAAFTSVPWLSPDGADESRVGDEWELAHATAMMAGANVRHVPIDAKDYGVIQGIEHLLDIHDGLIPSMVNHYWCHAIWDAAASIGSRSLLTGALGNITVSWAGDGSALLALKQGNLGTAMQLFFRGESNPWLTLKRQILKPLLTPARRLIRRARARSSSQWLSYSAVNMRLARELDIESRMRANGFDPTFTHSPLAAFDLDDLLRRMTVSAGSSETGAWHSFACLDPTANQSMLEFILRTPDEQFQRKGVSRLLIKRAFQHRMPAQVLSSKKGLQAADVGHRIVHEMPFFQECLNSLESTPEVREAVDTKLLRSSLEALTVKVDSETTATALTVLLPGIGTGLFLRRLAAPQV